MLALLISLVVGVSPAVAVAPAQTVDSAKLDDGPTRAWLSLGLGAGSSAAGGMAVRGAASIAVSHLLFLTLEETALSSVGAARTVASTNLLVGVQTSNPRQFVFLSAGGAATKCGSGCTGQSGIAVDGGLHIGGKHAGVALVGFVVRTPKRNSSNASTSTSGVAVSMDLGWFVR